MEYICMFNVVENNAHVIFYNTLVRTRWKFSQSPHVLSRLLLQDRLEHLSMHFVCVQCYVNDQQVASNVILCNSQ
jgi:hypothetical protein